MDKALVVDPEEVRRAWDNDGFVILPGLLSSAELEPACAELGMLFPTAEEFHGGLDPARNARFADEFGGIDDFPFASVEVSLLAVHHELITLAAVLLRTDRLRVYSIEAWAKFTGAADYDQPHHRDHLSQTLVAPSRDISYQQVEMFLYLTDVPLPLGPPAFVPRRYTTGLPAIPNWFPKHDGAVDDEHPSWVSALGTPQLYDVEVSAAGPAGTVVTYANDTFHRGTALTEPGGARYTIHVNFRPEGVDWISRHSWQQHSNTSRWHDFVARASPKQLSLFSFPPPGHAYWTEQTLAATAERYPSLDLAPWRKATLP
jgi:hypothetical protein